MGMSFRLTEEEVAMLRDRRARRRQHPKRDAEIVREYIAGESMAGIASAHRITRQRVQQIIARFAREADLEQHS